MRTNQETTSAGVGNSAQRRRPLLATITAFGVTVGLLGVAGVFAAGSDRATTGTNDASTGEIVVPPPPSTDLQISSASFDLGTGAFSCGDDWRDDLTTGVITASDVNPYDEILPGYDEGYLCLRNAGDATVGVTQTALDVVDSELACSPGEAEAGDETCESGVGELSHHLGAQTYTAVDGTTGLSNCGVLLGDIVLLSDLAATDQPLFNLAPGEVMGVCPGIGIDNEPIAQTDQVTWAYAYDAGPLVDAPGQCATGTNHSFGTASVIGYTSYPAEIACADVSDFYRFTATSMGTQVWVDYDQEAVDIDVEIFDAQGNSVEHLQGEEGFELSTYPFAIGQDYVVEVYGFDHGTGPYTLTLGTVPFG